MHKKLMTSPMLKLIYLSPVQPLTKKTPVAEQRMARGTRQTGRRMSRERSPIELDGWLTKKERSGDDRPNPPKDVGKHRSFGTCIQAPSPSFFDSSVSRNESLSFQFQCCAWAWLPALVWIKKVSSLGCEMIPAVMHEDHLSHATLPISVPFLPCELSSEDSLDLLQSQLTIIHILSNRTS